MWLFDIECIWAPIDPLLFLSTSCFLVVLSCIVVVVVSGVGSTVSALSFDHSATYLAIGTGDGHVRVAVVKDWSEPLVSGESEGKEGRKSVALVDCISF